MKKVLLGLTFAVAIAATPPVFAQETKHNYKPPAGVVPDTQTAIAIAVAVWSPIYGREHIKGEAPFHARLHNGVWFVSGSLPKGHRGGVPEIEIARSDGRIIRISHGR